MSAARAACLLLVTACAAPQVRTETAAVTANTASDSAAATTDAELSRAWEPEAPRVVAAPQRPPPEAPPVDRTVDFKAALARADAAFKKKQYDDARTAVATAVTEAARLDGPSRLQAGQLAFRIEAAVPDADAAADAAEAWLRACGPEKAESCRSAAVAAVNALAKREKKLTPRARALADDETCAAKAERAPKPQPCEATASKRAERRDDGWLVQKLALARALRESDAGRQAALLEKAEGRCDAAPCAALRRRALTKLLGHARARGDVDAALGFALREVAVINAALPEPERRWQRTAALEQTCAAYDKAHGAGTCRGVEKKTLGYWTFRDWSRDAAGTGLSAEQVRTVNEHFSPLLQECLGEQARRMTPPDAARFEVRWVVFNDGRVGEAHLRRDLDDSLLAKCLRAQFSGWRYPRYEGEFQNVEQSFTVTATERRTFR